MRPAPIEFSPLAVRLPRRRSPIRRPAAGCRPRPRLRRQPCKKRPRSRPGPPGAVPRGADSPDDGTAPMPPLSPMPEEVPLPTPVTGAGGTASGGEIATTAPGAYLDSAVPMTVARFRFQDGSNDNFPNGETSSTPQMACLFRRRKSTSRSIANILSTRLCRWRRSSSRSPSARLNPKSTAAIADWGTSTRASNTF